MLIPRTYIVLAAVFFLALASTPASAEEKLFGDEFLRAYGDLESYCDSGTYFPPERAYNTPRTFERCVHRDGRYKTTEKVVMEGGSVDGEWSDGRQMFNVHRYVDSQRQWAISYQVSPLRETGYKPAEHLPRIILEWFGIPVRPDGRIREFLNHFTLRPDLNRDGLIAYQEWAGYHGTPDLIIWVSPEDGLIRRTARGSAVNYLRVVDEVRTDAVLTRSDLTMDVPLEVRVERYARFEPFSAFAWLSFGMFLLGMLFWQVRWIFVRGKRDMDEEDHRDRRNAALRRYSIFAGSLATVVIALSALAMAVDGGGHPPLSAFVLIYAIPIVGVLWLVMCFLLARHLAEIPRRIRSR